jgi:hypothetical protein
MTGLGCHDHANAHKCQEYTCDRNRLESQSNRPPRGPCGADEYLRKLRPRFTCVMAGLPPAPRVRPATVPRCGSGCTPSAPFPKHPTPCRGGLFASALGRALRQPWLNSENMKGRARSLLDRDRDPSGPRCPHGLRAAYWVGAMHSTLVDGECDNNDQPAFNSC